VSSPRKKGLATDVYELLRRLPIQTSSLITSAKVPNDALKFDKVWKSTSAALPHSSLRPQYCLATLENIVWERWKMY
jgi:hypothetical protein